MNGGSTKKVHWPLNHWNTSITSRCYISIVDTEPREFKDVTIYTPGNIVWSNIVRIDAAWAKIWVGPYAQHETSVHVEFIRNGKRKVETLVSSHRPYVVVVPTTHAIQPDDLYLPSQNGVSSSRYNAADPRWTTDFDEQLRTASVPIVADYRGLSSDAETPARSVVGSGTPAGQLPVLSKDPATDSKSVSVDREYEEGIRTQAERSFFSRNPRLVQQAKNIYGCVCQVCGFNFAKTYGPLGQDVAEVHHLNPLSERTPEEWTEAVKTNVAEVAVLCSNCHRMIHRRKPALSMEELRAIVSMESGAGRIG